MNEHLARRLRWFLLLGAVVLVAGMLLGCIAELRTSAWMVEYAGKPVEYFLDDDNNARWHASVQVDVRLLYWANMLMPLGAGALLGAAAGLIWISKGRFRLRSLLIAMTFLCLMIGIPFGLVRPRLQNPRFVYRPSL